MQVEGGQESLLEWSSFHVQLVSIGGKESGLVAHVGFSVATTSKGYVVD